MLADGPPGNLDSRTGKDIIYLLDEPHRQDGTTIVVITETTNGYPCKFMGG